MSLIDYVAIPDRFEFQEQRGGFDFPCCVCVHRGGSDSAEPCRTCGHNANCWPEDGDDAPDRETHDCGEDTCVCAN